MQRMARLLLAWVVVVVLVGLAGAKRAKGHSDLEQAPAKDLGKATSKATSKATRKAASKATSTTADSFKPDPKLVAQFWMQRFDEDHDGVLVLSEVESLVREQLGGGEEQKSMSYSRSIFNLIDQDEDNKCTTEELVAFQVRMEKESPGVEARKKMATQRIDDTAAARIKGEL